MSVLLLIYLILLIISFNILYTGGGYKKLYVKTCERNMITFIPAALLATLISPFWFIIGIIDGLTRK